VKVHGLNKTVLSGSRFVLEVTTQGAVVTALYVDGRNIVRDVPEDIQLGEKGGFFCCPQIFGRLPNRTLAFNGDKYELKYPAAIVDSNPDVDRLFLHGFEHWLKWEIDINEKSLEFSLSHEMFDQNFPFPHTSFIRYELLGEGVSEELQMTVGIRDVVVDTPAMLTFHPFFRWIVDGKSPSLRANLRSRFENPAGIHIPEEEPCPLRVGDAYKEFTNLPGDLDHSFISDDGIYEIRWGDFGIVIQDMTPINICPVKPVILWTSAANERDCFGVEPGGPANLFNLVEKRKVPKSWLPVCKPGREIFRQIRIE